MRELQLLSIVMVCAGSLGCLRDQRFVLQQTYEAEHRAIEDRIYEIEYDVEQIRGQINEIPWSRGREVVETSPLDRSNGADGSNARGGAKLRQPRSLTRPAPPSDDEPADMDLKIDEGKTTRTLSDEAVTSNEPLNPPTFISGDPPSVLREPANARSETSTDRKIAEIVLDPKRTHGAELDNRPGDDGIALFLQPRNAAGEVVLEPGTVTVVLLDPAKSGNGARVGRWEFDADAVKGRIDRDAQGIALSAPWTGPPPENSNLRLFVRLETADGRKWETDRTLSLSLGGPERWTPRGDEPSSPRAEEALPAPTKSPAKLPSPGVPELLDAPAPGQPMSQVPVKGGSVRAASATEHQARPRRDLWRPER